MTNSTEKGGHQRREEQQRERQAQEILRRVERESETIGTSSLSRTANKAIRHLAGTETPGDDAIEIWGKRIGRVLGLIVFVVLLVHVLTTYILPD